MNAIRPLRILGLDPGLRRTGWGVVAVEGARLSHVAHGVIAPKDSLPFAERLLILFDAIAQVIDLHTPDEAAEVVSAAAHLAFDGDRQIAVLISQRMLGRKKWVEQK